MNKIVSSMLAFSFILATLGTTSVSKNIKKDLVNQLSDEEINIYKNIINERRNIYFMGLCLGVILSIIYILFLCKIKNNIWFKIICGIAITMTVNYFFYILYPKSQYMIQHLDKKSENIAWLKIYKTMQFRYHLAFLLGLISSGFLFYSIC
tara:strand:- start:1476 stop:1928 length:453 start_codon:yes stop_codon:yes gene_type:complete